MIIAFANEKGGVAKTTSTFNIAHQLADIGKKVLVIDLDAQASLTICCGLEPYEDTQEKSIVNVFRGKPLSKNIVHLEKFDLVPANLELSKIELELTGRTFREKVLDKAIRGAEYDFILLDCPPQLSMITINALSAANGVIIPVKTDYLSYRGIELLLDTVNVIKSEVNSELCVVGYIATMYRPNTKSDNEILGHLKETNALLGVVNETVKVRDAIYNVQSISDYAKTNKAATAYKEITERIMEHEQQRRSS